MHPVAVLRWWVLLTVSPFGGIYLAVKSGSLIIGLLVCVAAMVYAGLRILVDWWIVWIAITNKRFIRVEGLLRVNTLAVQLSSLRILHESETFGSRGSYWLGLGDYITVYTDTPAQNEPFKHTSHMPDRHAVMALLDKHIPRDAEQDTESSGILRQILGLLQKALGPSEAKKSQGGEKDDR